MWNIGLSVILYSYSLPEEMPKENAEEKIFYNALNLASEGNFALIAVLQKCFHSFKKSWLNGDKLELPSASRIEPATIANFLANREKINPEKEWQKLVDLGVELILANDKNYPELLKETGNPPLALYQLGKYDEQKLKIAVVGTRRMTTYGKAVTEKLTRELAQLNITIVSGLAYGIDTISHATALEENGETIAVLGSGLNNIFPSANKKLAERISKKGALISEYALDAPPLKHHFPSRNRIISGLSKGVLVIEAPLKSGALITSRFALEQNREVFAVPGPIFSKNSEGTNELIKSGAKLVNRIEDILMELNIPLPDQSTVTSDNLNEEEKILFKIIESSEKPLAVDEIIGQSQMDAASVNQNLTFLELKNLVKFDGSGYRIKF